MDLNTQFKPNAKYRSFLNKFYFFYMFGTTFFTWLMFFSYMFFLFMDPSRAVFWTFASLALLFFGLTILFLPFARYYYKKKIENYWWSFDDEKITIHHGVFSSNLVRIHYNRIQNINLEQNFFERRDGYYKIKIETAGSARVKAEGLLPGLMDPQEQVDFLNSKISLHGISKDGLEPSISDNQQIINLLNSIDKELKVISEKMK
ncbi:MAG: PH domain-containing protein [Candidatus Heimdallarchaeota archaeon]|nr:PH domain-containing protein [Candidatus Heimdallarchaeota archaeon]